MSNQMITPEKFEHFFKPEVRSAGLPYFTKDNVRISQPSDTEIQAFIKGSMAVRVSFKTPTVESKLVILDCTCPTSKKDRFCKHMWATLLKIVSEHPDFLESKSVFEKKTSPVENLEENKATFTKTTFKPQSKPQAQEQMDRQQAYKDKQNEYRKEQYQKQKQRLKDKKSGGKPSKFAPPSFPAEVEIAISYFAANGFSLENPLNPDVIKLAKKKLSRVFHPDIGGSHDEILELNNNTEILLDYLGIKS